MKKKYTIKDIARECGVSTATVSYVLNDVPNQSISAATKKRILQIANMVGYVSSASARALATGRTNNFGVYVPYRGNSAHKQRLLQALAEEAEKAGYHLVLLTGKCLTQQVTNVDAVFAVDIPEEEFARLGDNLFAPLLYLDGETENFLFYCFSLDGAYLREKALALTGCSKAVLVTDEMACLAYRAYLERHFDALVTPEDACQQVFPADTAVLLTQYLPVDGRSVLLADEPFAPLYGAYAQAAVSTAIRAIMRDQTMLEHHIRIS